jgi:hypothetical protein
VAPDVQAWRPVAAYLYLLKADRSALAWEYLRRNTEYREDFKSLRPDDPYWSARWGLATAEDPELDSRAVRAVWSLVADCQVELIAQPYAELATECFSLWSIPGRKSLRPSRRAFQLTSRAGPAFLELRITSDVADGEPFAYVVRPGPMAAAQCQAIERYLEACRERSQVASSESSTRPDRIAMLHMRSLQALDAIAAGASQRDIAEALFGTASVSERWHADSELRAQVRHLIRRGRSLVDGGYRTLLIVRPRQHGEEEA